MATGRIPSVQNASTLAGATLATNVTASSLTSFGTSPALTTPTISTFTTNGDILYGTGSGAIARLGIGSSAQVLSVVSGIPAWSTPATGSTFVGALASTRATQNLSNNVQTAINLATETYDTDSFHSTVTNPSRFTIPAGKGGTYLFFATGGTDYYTGGLGIRFAKNGTNQGSAYYNFSSPASGLFVGSLTTVLSLVATDYVELVMIQNSGSNKAVAYSGSEDFTFMGCTYLGA